MENNEAIEELANHLAEVEFRNFERDDTLAKAILAWGYRKPSAGVGLDEKKIYESLEVLNIVLAGNGISNLSKIQMSAISETICSKFSPQPLVVKLPKPLTRDTDNVLYERGWNACLEAVQRMNGGKG